MVKRIPETVIDEIISKTDIVDVVNQYVPLSSSGNEFTACCPFHEEKTPSFTVSPQKQFYHCFGCGAHGSAIGFLMEHQNLTFLEAVELLASQANIRISAEKDLGSSVKSDLLNTLESATNFYEEQLRRAPTKSKAINYLKGRGISGLSAKKFRLGYAPEGWQTLTTECNKKQLALSNYEKLGLIGFSKERHYDKFRDRVMFPIRNRRGKIVGFGGRTIADANPKYINSPESDVFKKNQEIYGLYETLQVNRPKRIMIVEGYLDVISLHQNNLNYAVATLGTAVSSNQIEMLFRESSHLIFCFDGDRAGRNAAKKAAHMCLPKLQDERHVEFCFLPDGYDPDSMVRKFGENEFFSHSTLMDPHQFIISEISTELKTTSDSSAARIVARAKSLFQSIPDLNHRALSAKILSDVTNIDQGLIRKELGFPEAAIRRQQSVIQDFTSQSLVDQLSAILLQTPSIVEELTTDINQLSTEFLPESETLLKIWKTIENPNITPGQLIEKFRGSDTFELIKKLHAVNLPFGADGAILELNDGIKKLNRMQLDLQIQKINEIPFEHWSNEQKSLVRNYKKTKS